MPRQLRAGCMRGRMVQATLRLPVMQPPSLLSCGRCGRPSANAAHQESPSQLRARTLDSPSTPERRRGGHFVMPAAHRSRIFCTVAAVRFAVSCTCDLLLS